MVAVSLLLLAYTFVLRPMFSRVVADQIAPAAPSAAATAAVSRDGSSKRLAMVIAALPAGEVVLTEEAANAALAAMPEALAPLDAARLRFTDGRVIATVHAYGLQSDVGARLTAEQGRLVVTEVRLDAPLVYLLSGEELAHRLAERLNAELAAQGRSIEAVRIEEGRLIVVTD